jgi:hypothetical protein
MIEEWKPIKDFPDYRISNKGRIQRVPNNKIKGGLLNPTKEKDGYLVVGLFRDKKNIQKRVHRLVAEVFIPNPNNYPCVNHKDENKTNNSIDNLEWCTVAYNNKYGNHYKKSSITMSKPIHQYDLSLKYIRTFSSLTNAAKELKCSMGGISSSTRDPLKYTFKGYRWSYKKL